MKISQVAVQLYTLRNHLGTAADYARTLDRVKEIGYRSVQVSGPRPVSESEIAELCRERGLVINSSHDDSNLMLNDPAQIHERMRGLGITMTAFPWPPGVDFGASASVTDLVRKLDAAGQYFHRHGLILTYHNHHMEFRRADDGRIGLDRIYGETNPLWLQGELDTYWVQYGGGSVVAWIERLKNRLPLLHLKDYRINAENKAEFAEIGYGSIDFKSVIAAAEAAGTQWFIVEQDDCPECPFKSLEMSFRYIRDNLVA